MISSIEINQLIEYLTKIGNTTRRVNGRPWTVAELAKIRSKTGEYGGGHDCKLILADACLAWRNQYKKKVIPRLESIKERYQSIESLEDLMELIKSLGNNFNRHFWDFDSLRRKMMLEELVDAFIAYKRRTNINDDLEAMRHWARNARPEDYNKGINGTRIRHLGIANFQYLRMLCGVDAIKPDSHILQGIKDALGYSKTPLEAIQLAEKVSKQTGISLLELDQILWVYFASEIPDVEHNTQT